MDNVLISDDVRIMASYETGPDSSWHIQVIFVKKDSAKIYRDLSES
jgi:hypothetical protein